MLKKFIALFLAFCTLIFITACDLETSSTQSDKSSTSTINYDDMFYDEESEASSENVSEEADVQTTTTSTAPVSDETSSKTNTSSKVSTSSKKTETSKASVPNDEKENLVWIPTNGGKKYHSKSSCSNMKNPEQVSKSTAISYGFTPCKKCYK